jgi:hypothetical protein
MFHLKQLDDFLKLKGIPKAYQLAVARKSVTGNLFRQWIEAILAKLKSYEDNRQAFLSNWWDSISTKFGQRWYISRKIRPTVEPDTIWSLPQVCHNGISF